MLWFDPNNSKIFSQYEERERDFWTQNFITTTHSNTQKICTQKQKAFPWKLLFRIMCVLGFPFVTIFRHRILSFDSFINSQSAHFNNQRVLYYIYTYVQLNITWLWCSCLQTIHHSYQTQNVEHVFVEMLNRKLGLSLV